MAVMECDPTERVDLVMIAWLLRSVPVPSEIVPSLKVTVPLGVPEVAGLTVAVNVTDCPDTEGFAEETSVVDVAAALPLMVWVSTGEVLPVKLASPP